VLNDVVRGSPYPKDVHAILIGISGGGCFVPLLVINGGNGYEVSKLHHSYHL
jgi:hypothetical protein